jgi:hypothetical protein
MVVIGTLVNTVFISTYLRPKIAADRSPVLNFYWMFVASSPACTRSAWRHPDRPDPHRLLKAIVDTVTARSSWQLIELEDEDFDRRPRPMIRFTRVTKTYPRTGRRCRTSA